MCGKGKLKALKVLESLADNYHQVRQLVSQMLERGIKPLIQTYVEESRQGHSSSCGRRKGCSSNASSFWKNSDLTSIWVVV